MNRISSLETLMFIVLSLYLIDLDFSSMSILNWIGFTATILWLILFIIKHLLPKKQGGKQ